MQDQENVSKKRKMRAKKKKKRNETEQPQIPASPGLVICSEHREYYTLYWTGILPKQSSWSDQVRSSTTEAVLPADYCRLQYVLQGRGFIVKRKVHLKRNKQPLTDSPPRVLVFKRSSCSRSSGKTGIGNRESITESKQTRMQQQTPEWGLGFL